MSGNDLMPEPQYSCERCGSTDVFVIEAGDFIVVHCNKCKHEDYTCMSD